MKCLRYGSRYINTNCPIIVFFTLVQSISGVIVTGVDLMLTLVHLLLAGILTGLVMDKFSQSVKARSSAIKFSERAAVMQRFCLASSVFPYS